MSRPKKREEKRLRHIIRFRLADAEFDALRCQAEETGLSAHECARLKTTASVAVVVSSAQAEPCVMSLRQELRRVGLNMNQIARRLNATDQHEPEELREASNDLRAVLTRLMDQMVGW